MKRETTPLSPPAVGRRSKRQRGIEGKNSEEKRKDLVDQGERGKKNQLANEPRTLLLNMEKRVRDMLSGKAGVS